MADFKPIYDTTLVHEGGFQKFPDDSANWVTDPKTKERKLIGTNHGISASAYHNHYKKLPTEADMKALTKAQAFEIFKKNYWNKINGDKIKNQYVAQLMFQFIIGSGASQLSDLKAIANITARKKIMAEVDVSFTDKEAEIINSLNQEAYWKNLKSWRHAFFIKITKKNPKLLKFLKGWQKRLDSYIFKDSGSGTSTTTGSSNGNGGKVAFFFTDSLSNIAYAETEEEANKNINQVKPNEIV